jgi:hypothetical protein
MFRDKYISIHIYPYIRVRYCLEGKTHSPDDLEGTVGLRSWEVLQDIGYAVSHTTFNVTCAMIALKRHPGTNTQTLSAEC